LKTYLVNPSAKSVWQKAVFSTETACKACYANGVKTFLSVLKAYQPQAHGMCRLQQSFMRSGMRALVLTLLAVLLAGASARELAVYPFASADILTGVAISERVAEAFDPIGDVLGPTITPALIPPLVAEGGFLSPVVFLPASVQQQGLASAAGVSLVRDSLGVNTAVTGSLQFVEARLQLELFIADFRGLHTYTLYAPEDNPGDLAFQTVALLLRHLSVRDEAIAQQIRAVDTTIDLSTDYSEYIRAVALAGGGFAGDARNILAELAENFASTEQDTDVGEEDIEEDAEGEDTEEEVAEDVAAEDVADDEDAEVPMDDTSEDAAEDTATAEATFPARWQRLLDGLEQVARGRSSDDRLLDAALALSFTDLDEQRLLTYFDTLLAADDVPAANVWAGTLRDDVNDRAGANSAFEAAANYPYGRAARAVYLVVNDLEGADQAIRTASESDAIGALLAVAYATFEAGDSELEKPVLTRLTRLAPTLPYSFERLSFIAFDEDDPTAATNALVVATRLEPDSDLYWTNLGWSYYLLDRLEESRTASQRAVTLAPGQEIAWFNLGLAYAVEDNLEQAMPAYEAALAEDPDVNDEAIVDLENALEIYPDAAGVHYALATLYEAEGRKDDSIAQFEQYLARVSSSTPFVGRAEQRLEVLRAPAPPINISEGASLSLGEDGRTSDSFQPGDRIYPRFELFTPGIELPRSVTLEYTLTDAAGELLLEPLSQEQDIPRDAVAINISGIGVTLPDDLDAGEYSLNVAILASEDRRTEQPFPFNVGDAPSFVRRFVSRNIIMRSLETGAPFYDEGMLTLSNEALVADLVTELRQTAEVAAEALPTVELGRFEGFDGERLFSESTSEDVSDFLRYLLASSSTNNADFSFVEAYAQWALDGAPSNNE
jgi:tetratricopeptide (TPR) repeat protein